MWPQLLKTTTHKTRARVRVALADFNSGAGFLPDLVDVANSVQEYYDFDLIYLPFPSGAIVRGGFEEYPDVPRFSLTAIQDAMVTLPADLEVQVAIGLTKYLIATATYSDMFTEQHPLNRDVRFVSTYGVRDYASQADVSFARATLSLCLSELLRQDPRWKLEEHPETVGCLLDFCENRDDLVVSLKRMAFEHKACRSKVRDPDMLAAIDRLLGIELPPELLKEEARPEPQA